MGKYKCEYFSKITDKKEIAIMPDKFDFPSIMDNNVDFNKEIKIFEKDGKWKLIQRIVNGKLLILENKKEETETQAEEAEEQSQALQQEKEKFNGVMDFMKKDICPSRENNQSIFQLCFDYFFRGEDISKPKMSVIKGENKKHE